MCKAASTEEFRAWVLEAYRDLLIEGDFAELAGQRDKRVKPYSVRIGSGTTVIEVEGISWGADVWTKVFRLHEANSDCYGLPIWDLVRERRADEHDKPAKRPGQRSAIFADAADLVTYAQDVLSGDFIGLAQVEARLQRAEAERLTHLPSPEEKAARTAAAEAGHAFQSGEYAQVVKLLEPHLALLPASQVRRYELSLERLTSASS